MEATSATSSATSSVDGNRTSVSGSEYLNLGMFSAHQQSGEQLLLGGAGFGSSSLGNGFGNETIGAGTSFDLTDFPSLGGNGAVGGSGNGLAAALRQQQQQQQQQQQLLAHQQMLGAAAKQQNSNQYRLAMTGANGNFNMATEDFPALGGPTNTGNSGIGSALNASSLLTSQPRTPANGSLYGNSDFDNNTNASGVNAQHDGSGGGLLGGVGLGGLGGLRGLQQQNTSVSRVPTAISSVSSAGAVGSSSGGSGGAGHALSGDFGLLGLLGVIRMTDADRNALALGSDLTMLGLNLGSTEQIYSTFSSPYTDGAVSKEPHFQVCSGIKMIAASRAYICFAALIKGPFAYASHPVVLILQLPACYYMQPPALKTGHLSKFQLETLFYIFYALPKDVLQAYAAQELYVREWRYHDELKLWFKRAGPSDGFPTPSGGATQYLYFDINSWERRLFNGSMNQNITSGFLTEDEVRVKFPSS
jgi:CCR4-NOT transcription complex subunit 2